MSKSRKQFLNTLYELWSFYIFNSLNILSFLLANLKQVFPSRSERNCIIFKWWFWNLMMRGAHLVNRVFLDKLDIAYSSSFVYDEFRQCLEFSLKWYNVVHWMIQLDSWFISIPTVPLFRFSIEVNRFGCGLHKFIIAENSDYRLMF